jgi:hypothetical protein
MNEITKRQVRTKYGTFYFDLVEYPGPSPLIDISLDNRHLGYADYCDLTTATDLELLEMAANIKYETDEDEWA